MHRRDFLAAGLFAPAFLGGCAMSLEQGLMNECRDNSRAAILRDRRVLEAWNGLRAERVWDCHVHLFGNGRLGSGIWVDPQFDQAQSIGGRVRRAFFMNAGCVGDDWDRLDQGMVARLIHVADALPKGAKLMLLAFDFTYDETGKRREDLTTFSVPDAYARKVAQMRPDRFEWIASVHPYRTDAIAALEAARAGGARAIKWLPPAMGIDLASPRCGASYETLKRLDMPLLVHVDAEQAVHGAGRGDLANPLALRHPLDRGVRVIAAHCASLGRSPDLDASRDPGSAPQASNFDLFARLMSERSYDGLLFGDLSATTQANRGGIVSRLLARREWEGRLLNGSDYPLPGMMPIFSLNALVSEGVLDPRVVPVLRELREVNALMFDFVLKRSLRYRGAGIPASAFETRGFFERGA